MAAGLLMSERSTADIAKLIDLLRAKGVRLFEGNGLKLELGPVPDDGKPAAPGRDSTKCRCGHEMHAHTEGLCILGCEATACLDGETAAKLEATS